MAKKQHVLIIDTETTVENHVADFGAVLCDRKGRVLKTAGVLISDFYGHEELFYDQKADPDCIWSKPGLERRKAAYEKMLDEGTRGLYSVSAVNRWLERCVGEFNPYVTAYNFAFDLDKCKKSGIDLTIFERNFCLWRAAAQTWCRGRDYKQFALKVHAFNSPTKYGNMTYKTNAETVARFVLGLPDLEDEPHTALEDALYYEKPILDKLWRKFKRDEIVEMDLAYNWRDYQVRDHFQPN